MLDRVKAAWRWWHLISQRPQHKRILLLGVVTISFWYLAFPALAPLPTNGCRDAPVGPIYFALSTTIFLALLIVGLLLRYRFVPPFVWLLTVIYVGSLVPLFAGLYMLTGIIDTTAPNGSVVASNRWDYLYFSIVTFTTLGYGDFQPCPAARPIAATQALLAFATYPAVIAAIVVMAQRANEKIDPPDE